MTHAEASSLVAELAMAFPRQRLTAETISLYASDLTGYQRPHLASAVAALRRSSRVFPSIAEIRGAVATARASDRENVKPLHIAGAIPFEETKIRMRLLLRRYSGEDVSPLHMLDHRDPAERMRHLARYEQSLTSA